MIEGNGIINAVLLAKSGGTKEPSVKQLALDLTSDYGINITSRGVTIEKKGKGFNLPDGVTPDKVKTTLSNLKAALGSTTSKYDLEKVRDILKAKGISLEQIAALEGKTGDELIQALLIAEGIDVYECLSQTTKDGIDKDLKEVEASAKKCIETKGSIKECVNLYDQLITRLKSLGGDKTLAHYSGRLDAILVNVQETKKAETETKQQIDQAKKEIASADFAALLRLIDKDIVKKNDQLKELVGQRLVELIKDDAAAADPTRVKSYLASYVRLPNNQKLISFNVAANHSYVILVEREGDK